MLLLLLACKKEKEAPPVITKTEAELQGVARTSLDSPTPTAAQLERRERSGKRAAELGLPVLASLPVTEDEATVKPRSADELASRCIATAICAIKGEEDDQALIDDLVKRFDARELFSPAERAYLAKQPAPQKDRVEFGWRYECVHVFLWALGYVDALNAPNEMADAGALVRTLTQHGREGLAKNAKPRPMSELLEQADLYYRLHWGATDLRLKGKSEPKVDEEIVEERHRALNWLIRYMNQPWDDVTTDT